MKHRQFMRAFLSEIRLTVSRLPDKIETMAQFPDLGLRTILFGEDAPFCEALPPKNQEVGIARVWLMQDQYHCRYILADAPGESQWVLLGPYSTEELTLTDITRLYQKRGVAHIDTNILRQYYLSLPRLRDESFMDAVVHAHCLAAYGSQGYEIGYWKLESELPLVQPETKSAQLAHIRRSMEQRYAAEREMMAFIAQGNYYGASLAKSKLGLRNQNARSGSTLRDRKNYTIIFNTLCRVATEQGGVPPIAIDQCSNRFALEIETSGSSSEVRTIQERMLKEYCDLVRNNAPQAFSPLISRAIDILSADYAEAISLVSVSEKLNISTNYLSACFKKETGTTFTEFLTGIRIEKAKSLLVQTDLPVGEIALACGIPDLNYFSRLFKANVNTTPTQFRESAKKAQKTRG